jgi:DNA replication protein DnaC
MKRIGCEGFENYQCYNGFDESEFIKALDEGKELTGWSCNGKEYYQLNVNSSCKFPLMIEGTTRECPKLVEERKRIKPLLFQDVPMMTFYNFDSSKLENPGIIEEIKNFPLTGYQKLLLLGEPGRGKTHLAAALMDFLNSQKKGTVTRIDVEDLYDLFFRLNGFISGNDARDELKSLYEYPFIFIDDLGCEKHTEKEIFNYGFKKLLDDYCKRGRLIITSNLRFADMEKLYGEKINSRLLYQAMVRMVTGADYRMKNISS